ncbi:MAG: NPCBM/NEW2 domain-containing protein [Lentisphaeraceae bacterium]|nr:NPCBM/NEW2 domain-containing protein [Lentisphaeraceae bacterium]
MKYFLTYLLLLSSVFAESTKQQVDKLILQLDGNFKERKAAAQRLKTIPGEFYPYLAEYLKQDNISLEAKLQLSKKVMYPLLSRWKTKQRADWYHTNLTQAYKKFGEHNPKWDKLVYEILALVEEQFLVDDFVTHYKNALAKKCKEAVDLGCNDALIHYFHARAVTPIGERSKLHQLAKSTLLKSKYHPYFKFRVSRIIPWFTLRENKDKKEAKKLAESQLIETLKLLGPAIKEGIPFNELLHNLFQFTDLRKSAGPTRLESLKVLTPVIQENHPQAELVIKSLKGWIHLDERRNEPAEDLLLDSWEESKAEKVIGIRLLYLYRNKSELAKFDLWHKKMNLLDPHDYDAFLVKLDFLERFQTIDDYFYYAEDLIEQGGPLLRQLPKLLDKASYKVTKKRQQFFKDKKELQAKALDLLERGTQKYLSEYPKQTFILLNQAYYNSLAGNYQLAQGLFDTAGPVANYVGPFDHAKINHSKVNNLSKLYASLKDAQRQQAFIHHYREALGGKLAIQSKLKLTDLAPLTTFVSYGEVTVNGGTRTPTINGRKCSDFIFSHAKSKLSYLIPMGAKSFTTVAASPHSKSMVFSVVVDGKTVFKSEELITYKDKSVKIDIDLPENAKIIELLVDPLGSNHSDHSCWAYSEFKK